MKKLYMITSILALYVSSFSAVSYRQIDTLPVGTSIDLDSMNGPVPTGYLLAGNPYRAGTNYNPAFCSDLTISGSGLLWCFCDAINRSSFFETYHAKLNIDTLVKMNLKLSDTSAFSKVDTQDFSDGIYKLRDTGNYIIKTNRNNYCLVRFDAVLSSFQTFCGGTPPANCTFAYKVKLWYQNNGSADFRTAAAVKPFPNRKQIVHSGLAGHTYDIKGRKVSPNNRKGQRRTGIYLNDKGVILFVK